MKGNTKLVRRNFLSLQLTIFICFAPILGSMSQALVKPIKNGSGKYEFAIGNVKLEVDPAMSGRVVTLSLHGRNLLTGPPIESFNYGSTFWPSPQKEWGWPPPAVLDKNPYSAQIENDELILISGKDSRSGFQFTKVFSASKKDTSIHIKYTIKNVSTSIRKVAPWEITRVPTGGLSFFPLDEKKSTMTSTLPSKELNNINWYNSNPKNLGETNKKLFKNGRGGWLAHVYKDFLFVKKFPEVPTEKVAPMEEDVEIFANVEAGYVELENQGAYAALKPGESLTYEVKWYLRKLPANTNTKEGNMELVKLVDRILIRSNR